MYRVGVIGVGGIGERLAEDVVTNSKMELVALVDVCEKRLRAAGKRFDVPTCSMFTDTEDLYTHIDLDAVVIATPPGLHALQISDALGRGAHVFCEKPLVTTLEEARDVVDRVEASDRVLMVGYQRHLNPAYVAARDRWQNGDLEPRFITGAMTQDWKRHFARGTNWRLDPELGGGGHLFSVGTHVLEAMLWTTGLTPRYVTAEMDFYDDERKIDEQSALTVRFDNGAIASLGDSAIVPSTREHLHVWDDGGAVYLEGTGWKKRGLTVIDTEGIASTPELPEKIPTRMEAFVDAIESGSSPATASDALRVTALLEAAYDAARTGRRIAVNLE